jgi:uroporphyrinogen decarboxylase
MVGGGSSERILAKIAALQRVGWFVELIDRLVEESVDYLCAQVDAGAQVLQIFDSWAGDLVGDQRNEFVLGALERVVSGVRDRFATVPIILFARGVGADQNRVSAISGVSAIGVEAEFNLELIRPEVVVQGNLDPVALLAGVDVAAREAEKVCRVRGKRKHIFNLGHGIRVGTEPEVVGAVVDAVRRLDG